jgi:hypothetical protein
MVLLNNPSLAKPLYNSISSVPDISINVICKSQLRSKSKLILNELPTGFGNIFIAVGIYSFIPSVHTFISLKY